MKTEKDLLAEAYQVQDACNLSGVVHSFALAITRLRELHPDKGTDFINGHPVCVMYSDKIRHLSKSDNPQISFDSYLLGVEAYREIRKG